MVLSNLDILIRLFAATSVGILLGYERRHRGKQVGIRTHILVSISSCCIAIISAYGFAGLNQPYQVDPSRALTGVLTGIGFLGAGIIWQDNHGTIKGITTAANIWTSSVLGIVAGMGYYFLLAATLIIVLITLELSSLQKLRLVAKIHAKETNENSNQQPQNETLAAEEKINADSAEKSPCKNA